MVYTWDTIKKDQACWIDTKVGFGWLCSHIYCALVVRHYSKPFPCINTFNPKTLSLRHYHQSPFTDEEAEAQRVYVPRPKSHGKCGARIQPRWATELIFVWTIMLYSFSKGTGLLTTNPTTSSLNLQVITALSHFYFAFLSPEQSLMICLLGDDGST